MARVSGVNIPDRKQTWLSLTAIYGIGRTRAFEICSAAGISADVKVIDLTEEELDKLRTEVARHTIEGICAARRR